MPNSAIKNFFFPKLNRKVIIRIALVGIIAFIFFKYILIPFRISGHSMDPTYRNGDVNFCFTFRYLLSRPKAFDVVTVRLSGRHVMLLKRIIATEGQTVEFRKGQVLVNGNILREPYVAGRFSWDLPVRTVKKGHVYVVGDNRNVPIETHDFGQTPINRIIGAPLW
ncbi:MAG: signal peptidase I [Desulfobacteraceae bacterium]|nr:MAG: signal peptidase I [Desulfobacteraceae bacterium]